MQRQPLEADSPLVSEAGAKCRFGGGSDRVLAVPVSVEMVSVATAMGIESRIP